MCVYVCVCVNGIGDSTTSNCRSTPCLEIQTALRQTGLSAAPKWPKEGEKKNKVTKKKWILFLYDLCAPAHSGAHVMAAVANMLKLAGGLGGPGSHWTPGLFKVGGGGATEPKDRFLDR